MVFIFIINDYPMPYCTGQISRLCLRFGDLYMLVIIEFCFTCMAKKNQLMLLSDRRVLKLRLLRLVTPKINSI